MDDYIYAVFKQGHDTTGNGTVWAVFMLGTHPEVQKKVQEEVDTVIGTVN